MSHYYLFSLLITLMIVVCVTSYSLNVCLKATKDMNKCSTEGNNLEGCTGKIVKAVVDKWWADYNSKQPAVNDKGNNDGGKDKSNSNLKKSTSTTSTS